MGETNGNVSLPKNGHLFAKIMISQRGKVMSTFSTSLIIFFSSWKRAFKSST